MQTVQLRTLCASLALLLTSSFHTTQGVRLGEEQVSSSEAKAGPAQRQGCGGAGTLASIDCKSAEVLAMQVAHAGSHPMMPAQPNCNEDPGDDEISAAQEKRLQDQEDALADEEYAVRMGVGGEIEPVVAALPPAPSPMACKAKKDAELAQIAAKEAAESGKQLGLMENLSKFKKMKAKRYQEKAMKAFKKAADQALQVARDKAAAAEKASSDESAAQQGEKSKPDLAQDMAIAAARDKMRKAECLAQKAAQDENKAVAMKKAVMDKARITALAKAKANADAKEATQAVVSAAQQANEMMANLQQIQATGCGPR
jgi:hypothetical protein